MAPQPKDSLHPEGPEFKPLKQQDSSERDMPPPDLLADLEDELPVPPDGGWGWVVVAASFVIHVIADGVAYSFGVFIVEFLHYFPGAGRGQLGWISSLMVGVTLGSGPIASALTNKYGCRIVTIAGAVIAAFGFVISIWAPSIMYLYFSFGITAGFGLGLIYLPAIVSVTYYFEKKRAFATGLAVCGSGIGTFIFAPLTKMLMDEYGWRGASLILAGLLLNCVVCGALFRPLQTTKKPRKRTLTSDFKMDVIEVNENGEVSVLNGRKELPLSRYRDNTMSNSAHVLPVISDVSNDNMKTASSALCLQPESDETTHRQPHSQHVMQRKDILYSGSLNNIPLYRSNPALYTHSVTSLHKSHEAAVDRVDGGAEKSGCCSPETKNQFREMMDVSLLKDPLFLMFAISNFFTSIGFNSPYIYLPDKATQLGISYEKASFLISMIGIFNTIGRVVFGYLSDRKFVNRLMLYNTALTLCGVVTALSALCVTYPWLMAYSAAYGLFIGVYVSLTSVVLVDLLGLERLTSSFGLLLLFQGIATIVGPPLCGSVYDATKDYAASFYIIGAMIAVSGAMLYFIPCVRRCSEKQHAPSQHDKEMGRITTNVL